MNSETLKKITKYMLWVTFIAEIIILIQEKFNGKFSDKTEDAEVVETKVNSVKDDTEQPN
jgi:hypothetical protein